MAATLNSLTTASCHYNHKNIKLELHMRLKRSTIRTHFVNSSVDSKEKRKLKVLVAGGGISGLVFALAAKRRGFDVKVFERDLSAVRGEGMHRGPIQLLSSALAVLEAIDEDVATRIMEVGCVTGDRINGLADGLSGEWVLKLDLMNPAIKRGLPVTRVICRMALQDILLNAVGLDLVSNNAKVVNFIEDASKVTVILEDGRMYDGDILVGADGIWSKVRSKLFGHEDANYSGYTCYSGLVNFLPSYINTVGYRVFLGFNQYFVASDVGNGKMQWYAFHKEPSMSADATRDKKQRLQELFGTWCKEVVELISETPENMILQRDIYDRDMIYRWGTRRVTLLGDAAHPMQPNFGQGGCMAIEDCYQLILELDKLTRPNMDLQHSGEIAASLRRYQRKRLFRIRTVHTASRMASNLLAIYQPYIKSGPGPQSNVSTQRKMKHSVRVVLTFLRIFMPLFMTWMITGPGKDIKSLSNCRSI